MSSFAYLRGFDFTILQRPLILVQNKKVEPFALRVNLFC